MWKQFLFELNIRECAKCIDGMLIENDCSSCDDKCSICNEMYDNCQEWKSGNYLIGDKCKPCNIEETCIECIPSACSKCQPKYFLFTEIVLNVIIHV